MTIVKTVKDETSPKVQGPECVQSLSMNLEKSKVQVTATIRERKPSPFEKKIDHDVHCADRGAK